MFLNRNIKREEEGQYVYMTPEDMVIRNDPKLAAIAKQYVMNNDVFVQDFSAAWTKIMNEDRFKGPTGNECAPAVVEAPAAQTAKTAAAAGSLTAALDGIQRSKQPCSCCTASCCRQPEGSDICKRAYQGDSCIHDWKCCIKAAVICCSRFRF